MKWVSFVSGRNSAEELKMFCFLIIDVSILSYSMVAWSVRLPCCCPVDAVKKKKVFLILKGFQSN